MALVADSLALVLTDFERTCAIVELRDVEVGCGKVHGFTSVIKRERNGNVRSCNGGAFGRPRFWLAFAVNRMAGCARDGRLIG